MNIVSLLGGTSTNPPDILLLRINTRRGLLYIQAHQDLATVHHGLLERLQKLDCICSIKHYELDGLLGGEYTSIQGFRKGSQGSWYV